jgi:hypothetical protein
LGACAVSKELEPPAPSRAEVVDLARGGAATQTENHLFHARHAPTRSERFCKSAVPRNLIAAKGFFDLGGNVHSIYILAYVRLFYKPGTGR